MSDIKEIPARGTRGVPAALLHLSELLAQHGHSECPRSRSIPARTGTAAGRDGHRALLCSLSEPRATNGKAEHWRVCGQKYPEEILQSKPLPAAWRKGELSENQQGWALWCLQLQQGQSPPCCPVLAGHRLHTRCGHRAPICCPSCPFQGHQTKPNHCG